MWPLLALLTLPAAHAQPAPDSDDAAEDTRRARVLFENGRRLYQEGAYEAAIEAWEGAYDLSGRPELLYNLSNAYERLGDMDRALELLNRYRAQGDLTPEEHDQLARKASTLGMRVRAQQAEIEGASRKAGRQRAGAIITATGVAATALGLVLAPMALEARQEAEAACVDTGTGWLCPESANAAILRSEQAGTWSIVSLGAGAVGLLTGVSLLASGGNTAQPKAAVEVTWTF